MTDAPWREAASRGAAWWGEDGATLRRVLADQLHSELRRLRLGDPGGPPPWLWDDDTLLDAEGAPDSLDLLSLSAALAEMLPDAEVGFVGSWRLGDWCDGAAQARARPPRHVTFRSSGSTGAPARTTHRLDDLEREAAAFAALLGARRRVLCAVPSHHAYGFIHSVLLPRHLAPDHLGPDYLAPAGAVEVVELRGQAASRLASLVRPGDLVLGHPAFWEAALRGMFEALPPDVVGITSTAPCPDGTALGLRAAGLARLVQVYGSAETAGIGWRDDPAQPYALLPGWRRDGAGLWWKSQAGEGRAVDAPDRLAWEGEGFRVLGRRDGAVQVGGVNVSPEQVGARLARHPGVAEVAVRAMRPEEGARLKAFVVPAGPGGDPRVLRAALRRFAAAELSAAERPGAYAFGEALPRNGMGKLADWGGGECEGSGEG
jgi:long-chain acyl-CoA synthetase